MKPFYACLGLSILTLTSCSQTASAEDFEITDFRSGLVCHSHPEYDGGWICHVTEDIYMTGTGQCVYDGRNIPCTWYGFEFSYKNAPDGMRLSCQSKWSQPGNFGNPDGEIETAVKIQSYQLELTQGNGRFYNPQYSGLSADSMTGEVIVDETSCSYQDNEVFSLKFKLIYPNAEK